jgi:hypothetical protein
MTVSAGVGGGGIGGVVIGTGASGGGVVALPATLPFTGASQIMLMIAIACVLLVAGVLVTGLARRSPYAPSRAPS